MVLEAFAAGAFIGLSSLLGSGVSRKIGGGSWTQLALEMVSMVLASILVVSLNIISAGLAAIGLFALLLIGIFGILWKRRKIKGVRSGDHGEEMMWAQELIDEGDNMFIVALNGLTHEDKMEVFIIAESKDELRERAIERFEEEHGGAVPEDFIQ